MKTLTSEGKLQMDSDTRVMEGIGKVITEELMVELNRVGYSGGVSIEWEDNDVEQHAGARAALANVHRADQPPAEENSHQMPAANNAFQRESRGGQQREAEGQLDESGVQKEVRHRLPPMTRLQPGDGQRAHVFHLCGEPQQGHLAAARR